MGRQSSRIYLTGSDHKDIYFQGSHHDKMYIGGELVWEKLKEQVHLQLNFKPTNMRGHCVSLPNGSAAIYGIDDAEYADSFKEYEYNKHSFYIYTKKGWELGSVPTPTRGTYREKYQFSHDTGILRICRQGESGYIDDVLELSTFSKDGVNWIEPDYRIVRMGDSGYRDQTVTSGFYFDSKDTPMWAKPVNSASQYGTYGTQWVVFSGRQGDKMTLYLYSNESFYSESGFKRNPSEQHCYTQAVAVVKNGIYFAVHTSPTTVSRGAIIKMSFEYNGEHPSMETICITKSYLDMTAAGDVVFFRSSREKNVLYAIVDDEVVITNLNPESFNMSRHPIAYVDEIRKYVYICGNTFSESTDGVFWNPVTTQVDADVSLRDMIYVVGKGFYATNTKDMVVYFAEI